MSIDTRYEKTLFCAFQYNWYIDKNDSHWDAQFDNGETYELTAGRYRSNDPDTFFRNTTQAKRAGIDCFACSDWYGGPWYTNGGDDAFQSHSTFKAYLNWLDSPQNPVPDFKAFCYWELDSAPPTAANVLNLLEYHRANTFPKNSYLKKRAIYKTDGETYIDNQPVFAVYSEPVERISTYIDGVQLYEAAHPGETVYLILEITTGWTDNADIALVDCWHKYGIWGTSNGSKHYDSQSWIWAANGGLTPTAYSAYDSFTVSPGGSATEDGTGLARSAAGYVAAFESLLVALAAAPENTGPSFIFITSWDEFGEKSFIAPSPDWADGDYGYPDGYYMEVTAAYAESIKGEDNRKVHKFNISDGG